MPESQHARTFASATSKRSATREHTTLVLLLCLRAAARRAWLEQRKVDTPAHRQIAGTVGMKLVAGAAGGAFGNELRLQSAGLRIERDLVEIDHAVERARGADEIVERLALGVLFRETVRRAGTAQRRGDGGANDAQLRPLLAQSRDAVLHRGDNLIGRRVAVLREVVDAFEPDQAGNPR